MATITADEQADERRIRIAELILRLRRVGITDQRVLGGDRIGAARNLRAGRKPGRGICRAGAAHRLRPDDLGAGDRRHDDRGARSRDRDRVLEIGTGTGYQTAVLARLCRRVYTIERFRTLVARPNPVSRRFASPTSPRSSATASRAGRSRRRSTGSSSRRLARRAGGASRAGPRRRRHRHPGRAAGRRPEAHAHRAHRDRLQTNKLADVRFVPLIPGKAESGATGSSP